MQHSAYNVDLKPIANATNHTDTPHTRPYLVRRNILVQAQRWFDMNSVRLNDLRMGHR